MGGEREDAGFSATSKSGSTSLFNIGWLVAVLEVGAHGKGDKPVMTWRTVVVLGPAAITIEDKRARDAPDTSQEIVVFLCIIVSPRYLMVNRTRHSSTHTWWQDCAGPIWMCQDIEPIFIEGNRLFWNVVGLWDRFWRRVRDSNPRALAG